MAAAPYLEYSGSEKTDLLRQRCQTAQKQQQHAYLAGRSLCAIESHQSRSGGPAGFIMRRESAWRRFRGSSRMGDA